MNVRITPSRAVGTLQAPPSKSVAHRALLCGALSDGSIIRNVACSKDITATIGCLRALGAYTEIRDNGICLGGLNPFSIPERAELFCNESGSTLRFLIPLCMLAGKPVTFIGAGRLFQRPLSVYEELARLQDVLWHQQEDRLTVCGTIAGSDYRVPGNISSQFITGLLYALPLLPQDSTITVVGKADSGPYIDLTLDCLNQFGVVIHRQGNVFHIPGSQRLTRQEYTIEGDYSNAAYLEAFNLLGGDVRITGLRQGSLQGDRVYPEMFRQLGAGTAEFDLSDCPDLGPVMFAMAAATGGGVFTGIARLRFKESDRVAAMVGELAKMGIRVSVDSDRVQIHPGSLKAPQEPLCGHNDHRIVMALSLLCSVTGGTITDAQAVSKSFPDFFKTIQSLGIAVTM